MKNGNVYLLRALLLTNWTGLVLVPVRFRARIFMWRWWLLALCCRFLLLFCQRKELLCDTKIRNDELGCQSVETNFVKKSAPTIVIRMVYSTIRFRRQIRCVYCSTSFELTFYWLECWKFIKSKFESKIVIQQGWMTRSWLRPDYFEFEKPSRQAYWAASLGYFPQQFSCCCCKVMYEYSAIGKQT